MANPALPYILSKFFCRISFKETKFGMVLSDFGEVLFGNANSDIFETSPLDSRGAPDSFQFIRTFVDQVQLSCTTVTSFELPRTAKLLVKMLHVGQRPGKLSMAKKACFEICLDCSFIQNSIVTCSERYIFLKTRQTSPLTN